MRSFQPLRSNFINSPNDGARSSRIKFNALAERIETQRPRRADKFFISALLFFADLVAYERKIIFDLLRAYAAILRVAAQDVVRDLYLRAQKFFHDLFIRGAVFYVAEARKYEG